MADEVWEVVELVICGIKKLNVAELRRDYRYNNVEKLRTESNWSIELIRDELAENKLGRTDV